MSACVSAAASSADIAAMGRLRAYPVHGQRNAISALASNHTKYRSPSNFESRRRYIRADRRRPPDLCCRGRETIIAHACFEFALVRRSAQITIHGCAGAMISPLF
jgi:hypothetical protein